MTSKYIKIYTVLIALFELLIGYTENPVAFIYTTVGAFTKTGKQLLETDVLSISTNLTFDFIACIFMCSISSNKTQFRLI